MFLAAKYFTSDIQLKTTLLGDAVDAQYQVCFKP